MAAVGLSKRLVKLQTQACVGTRNMATLEDIRLRLKSVGNIQKITKSMKMVSAAKYAKAERELRPARKYGAGAKAFFENVDIENTSTPGKSQLIIGVSSDRGLCGGIHSSIAKAIKLQIGDQTDPNNIKVVLVGDKARSLLQRTHASNILMSMSDIGRMPPQFAEASFVAQQIIDSGYDFESGQVLFNQFKSVISYDTKSQDILSLDALSSAESLSTYDDVDAEVLKSYHEFSMANLIYYGMKENACSEQSSRMTAMDGASKNAGEVIDKLSLLFNRTRQAVITRELTEIVSGAAALE